MSEATTQLFNALVKDDAEQANKAFNAAMQDKVQDARDVRKVGLTAAIFNQETETSEPEEVET
jgi:hypothetical protein